MVIVNPTSHASYSFLIFAFVSFVFLGKVPAGGPSILAVAAGMVPDLDGLLWKLLHPGKKADTSFQHHLEYPTHWPVVYLPLVIFMIIAWLVNFYPVQVLALTMGIYSHLVFDSISCGDGMNWGAPWGRRFINLCSSKTDGYHGLYWAARFKKTVFYKISLITSTISTILLAWFSILHVSDSTWYILAIVMLVAMIVFDLVPVPREFEQEPPEGRYSDYRLKPGYYEKLSASMKERVRAWREARGLQG
jgi:hypothetical protein